MTAKQEVARRLAEIADADDSPQAVIARALIPCAADSRGENELLQKGVKECMFALISRCVATGRNPSAVIDALVSIDQYLAQTGVIAGPFACLFAPAAAALISHVEGAARAEQLERYAAEVAPIFEIDKKTLCAAAAAPLGKEGISRFAERILGAVLRQKPSKVRIVVRATPEAKREISDVLDALALDLKEQRISADIDCSFPAF